MGGIFFFCETAVLVKVSSLFGKVNKRVLSARGRALAAKRAVNPLLDDEEDLIINTSLGLLQKPLNLHLLPVMQILCLL